jgi:hypothetical protein
MPAMCALEREEGLLGFERHLREQWTGRRAGMPRPTHPIGWPVAQSARRSLNWWVSSVRLTGLFVGEYTNDFDEAPQTD